MCYTSSNAFYFSTIIEMGDSITNSRPEIFCNFDLVCSVSVGLGGIQSILLHYKNLVEFNSTFKGGTNYRGSCFATLLHNNHSFVLVKYLFSECAFFVEDLEKILLNLSWTP